MAINSTKVIDSQGIRGLIWTYFFLLMFDGILRKWVAPSLSTQLILARDPALLLIYIIALAKGAFPLNGYVILLAALGGLSALLGLTLGTRDLLVTAYGFDACFLHLPLIYIFPKVMTQHDVIKLGRAVLILTIPMAILMVMQFRASPDDWINCGAGGGIGSQIRGALGKIRPPGFFTFITGAAQFLTLATAFVLFGFLKKGVYSRLFLMGATFAIVIAAAVSTSRLALGGIGIVFSMIGLILFFNRESVGKVFAMLLPIGLVLLVATNLDIFQEGRTVFEARLTEAGDMGAGFSGTASNWSQRVFGDFYAGFEALGQASLLGQGLGLGTNVGARLTSGRVGFLLAESEWARVVLEMGMIVGPLYLLVRVLMSVSLFKRAAWSARQGNPLPLLLFGSCFLLLLSGQFGQATTVGFAVLGGGLCLAAANTWPDPSERGSAPPKRTPEATARRLHKFRGRSAYADALHGGEPSARAVTGV